MAGIVHTVASLDPDSGGPTRTVTSLVNHLRKVEDISVVLATQRSTGSELFTGELPGEYLSAVTVQNCTSIVTTRKIQRHVAKLVRDSNMQIIHDHGMWLPFNHAVAKLASDSNKLRVVHPRGMLEPGALAFKSLKKKLAWALYQKRDLASVTLFFATSDQEADGIRKAGCRQPIAIIPNGVEMPLANELRIGVPESLRIRHAVFISRIHPIKNLIELLRAWSRVKQQNWRLTLAGPDENGHLRDVQKCIQDLNLKGTVSYIGPVGGSDKAELLRSADLFILPSLSENFGVVVAEALSYGIPTIATVGTPWKGLLDNGCGWWIAPEAGALAGALRDAMSLSDSDRRAMGERGRCYASKFDWEKIAFDTAAVYRWLLGEVKCPDCVMLK